MKDNLMLCHVGNLLVEPTWVLKMHSHDKVNELIIAIRGREKIVTDSGTSHTITPGDAILFPRGRGHEEYNDSPGLLETIFLTFKGNQGNEFTVVHDNSSRLRNLAQNVLRLNYLQSNDTDHLRQAYLIAILGEFTILNQLSPSSQFVSDIRDYIHKNLVNPLHVDDLAKFANMSKFHFIRKYKSLTGRTPMEEVRQMRLREAHNLISATQFSLKEIAFMTGFTDEYTFSKNFKKHFGSPPGSYRMK